MTKEHHDRTVTLDVASRFEMLDIVQTVLVQWCGLVSFDEEATHYKSVAVRESVVNAIKHGNKGRVLLHRLLAAGRLPDLGLLPRHPRRRRLDPPRNHPGLPRRRAGRRQPLPDLRHRVQLLRLRLPPRGGGRLRVFHSADPFLAQELVSKLQERYLLQQRIG